MPCDVPGIHPPFHQAMVLRNYGMLYTVSIGFELMELTFQHWLPNFNECWWDSWILDFLVCNQIGPQRRGRRVLL